MLKCAIAYAVASCFTLVPFLSNMLGQPFDIEGATPNAHFIATVAVYYNPARSVGSMLEADLFMVWAASAATLVSLGAMATAVTLNDRNEEWLSHFVILVFWLAGSCGFIAYMKVKVGKATFGSACSMAALITSVIITKSGAIHLGYFETDVVLQLLFIVVIGTTISNLVCFGLFRQSAYYKLRQNVAGSLSSFSTLLDSLTRTFLLEEENPSTSMTDLHRASVAAEATFTSLNSAFDEAKLELLEPRMQHNVDNYEKVIGSLAKLAKHLTGMRQGCKTQDALLRELG